jgi:hypothetical protein
VKKERNAKGYKDASTATSREARLQKRSRGTTVTEERGEIRTNKDGKDANDPAPKKCGFGGRQKAACG